jgi:glyoxylase-like metal-dependent hydrolase (beta-lactamase superfamily II)
MKIGDYEILMADDGTFKLDGGAMFGVVPKTIWQKFFKPDDQNRIELSTNTLIIRYKKFTALVDLGMGDKFDEKQLAIYDIKREKNLIQNLEGMGIHRDEVTHVIITHGHLDHTGWATMRVKNSIIPTFPNAKYYFQEDTYEEIKFPNEKTRPNYNYLNFENLDDQLEIIRGDEEIFPGLELMKTGGHTKGHQVPILRAGNRTVIYFGDLLPTASHIKPAYIMAYDLYPMDTFYKKKELLEKANEEQWIITLEHEPVKKVVKLLDVEKYNLEQLSL